MIDLRKIDGDGSFPCPKYGVLIDPEDESEEVYGDPQAIMDKSETKLEAIILRCKKCHTQIKIIGF